MEMYFILYQSMIGHCLGAAGGLEAIATVKAITTGWLHPTINQFVCVTYLMLFKLVALLCDSVLLESTGRLSFTVGQIIFVTVQCFIIFFLVHNGGLYSW